MAYRVEWTAQAKKDVDGAVAYIAEVLKSPKAASDLIDAFLEAARLLAEMSEMCAISSQPSCARRNLRARFVKKCVMLYRFDDERVLIYRVFHTSRDYAKLI